MTTETLKITTKKARRQYAASLGWSAGAENSERKRSVFSEYAFKDFQPVQYTPMLDQNVSFTDHGATATYYYNQDERQSVRNLTDSSAAVAQSYDYTAYGDKIDALTSGSVEQRYTYTGRELNDVSGDYYFRFRMYGAYLGGFLSRDPIGFIGGGLALYAGYFARNFGMDPYGLLPTAPPGKVVVKRGNKCWYNSWNPLTGEYQKIPVKCPDGTGENTIPRRDRCCSFAEIKEQTGHYKWCLQEAYNDARSSEQNALDFRDGFLQMFENLRQQKIQECKEQHRGDSMSISVCEASVNFIIFRYMARIRDFYVLLTIKINLDEKAAYESCRKKARRGLTYKISHIHLFYNSL